MQFTFVNLQSFYRYLKFYSFFNSKIRNSSRKAAILYFFYKFTLRLSLSITLIYIILCIIIYFLLFLYLSISRVNLVLTLPFLWDHPKYRWYSHLAKISPFFTLLAGSVRGRKYRPALWWATDSASFEKSPAKWHCLLFKAWTFVMPAQWLLDLPRALPF